MRKHKSLLILLLFSVLVLVVVAIFALGKKKPPTTPEVPTTRPTRPTQQQTQAPTMPPTEPPTRDPFLSGSSIISDLLPVNPYSRPGTELKQVNAVVVHYVGNPSTTAKQNRDYFAGLADTQERSASSHYIIGLSGEIIQCVPLEEVSYASNNRNWDTIAIECCHPDAEGRFNYETYHSLVRLCAALCRSYGLNPESDLIRHGDVIQKECPKYYMNHEDEWIAFKSDVRDEMNR